MIMFTRMSPHTAATLGALLLFASICAAQDNIRKPADLQFAGALEFGPDGVLFVGDNIGGAVYAFKVGSGEAPKEARALYLDNIDGAVANALGVGKPAITINDMAVHPTTREVYLSVTRGIGPASLPAIVKVDLTGRVHNVRIAGLGYSKQPLHDVPDGSKQFRNRGLFSEPPTIKETVKSQQPMNVLAIMDIEYFKGEIFVSGISNEEFASTLRRLPYPFTGKYGSTKVRIFHIAHDQYETRAPIRSMVAKNLDGTDYLIASYTCSPVVLIPVKELKGGASITGRTIGDMGNGQPIDMFTFKNMAAGGGEYMFVTNNSRQPQLYPLEGLAKAKAYTMENTERGFKFDMLGSFPMGPVGRPVMFVGASLQADLLNDKFFVSLTRDTYTGSLNLESLPSMFPITLHHIQSEYDFPDYKPAKSK